MIQLNNKIKFLGFAFLILGANANAQVVPFGTLHNDEVSDLTYRDTETAVVEVTSATGRIWMDRNLGATSSSDAGHLYQWGRGADGHQIRTSSTTPTSSTALNPGHGDFILSANEPFDWRSTPYTNLWQGVNGTHNPCPVGYRLPTKEEWEEERLSWSSNNSTGALNSPLKLQATGRRNYGGGAIALDTYGFYWSSTVNSTGSQGLFFGSSSYTQFVERATGHSVRCIKEE